MNGLKVLTIANFCQTVRNALTLAGYSCERVRNVVNSSLGQMKIKTTGDDKTGAIKAKITKASQYATGTLKQGSIQFKDALTIERLFAAWNEAIAQAEKVNPTMTVTIGEQFTEWLNKVGKKHAEQTTEQVGQ